MIKGRGVHPTWEKGEEGDGIELRGRVEKGSLGSCRDRVLYRGQEGIASVMYISSVSM